MMSRDDVVIKIMSISLEVPLIHTQIYHQSQLEATDARVATCHLKCRKPEG